ncbi:hypothetical protein N7449_012283 [Penicillium cf. viridicatum]|uniref:Uncharacterized protein n=1 Tax=Penicillium cf. viridicatum TaxID=2972119 RepID=A0A9W9IRH5_9EURO|nr:hypothetical protein N7449_012283 [Penicillium cf. viridicatum]
MGNINYLLILFDAYSYTESHWMLLLLCDVWENLGSNEGPIAEKLQHPQRRYRAGFCCQCLCGLVLVSDSLTEQVRLQGDRSRRCEVFAVKVVGLCSSAPSAVIQEEKEATLRLGDAQCGYNLTWQMV